MKTVELISIQEGQWGLLSLGQQSREVGVMHGVVYGGLHKSYSDVVKLDNLLPITLRSKVLGAQCLEGLMDGLYRAAAVDAAHCRTISRSDHVKALVSACYDILVNKISKHEPFLSFSQTNRLMNELTSINHRIPASYPIAMSDFASLFKNYMKRYSYEPWRSTSYSSPHRVWVMSDFENPGVAGLLIIADEISKLLSHPKNQNFVDRIRGLN